MESPQPAPHPISGSPTRSYQVLARKWRPRGFADMVGQTHAVRALENALARGQLHHAYLLTGTRGVGKTTLARILAKALNCEQGVGPSPCGVCASCQEIDAGRCVDLLEVDAASRTKVDQTRELLDNVPFAPVRSRYKVYLIDEVHMFSTSSFNALLKTLEEPPPHVKFVLATTDPQKLPATVLSRCLQFHLKHLLPEQIQARLRQVLQAEDIAFEEPALALLARAADGSMRDGLSLLDQGIAFGGGQLTLADARAMLGTLDQDLTLALIEALCARDGARILAEIARAAALTPDFAGLLRATIACLHRLALVQQMPQTLPDDDPDAPRLRALAAAIAPEDLQLYYQIALLGQQDLPWAPDPRAGLEMVLLRALAFRPDTVVPAAATQIGQSGAPSVRPAAATAAVSKPAAPIAPASASIAAMPSSAEPPRLASDDDWHALVAELKLDALAGELARHCAFVSWRDGCLRLALDAAHAELRVGAAEKRLLKALHDRLGTTLKLAWAAADTGGMAGDTPAARTRQQDARRRQTAEEALQHDPVAQLLRARLDADWLPGSIQAAD